MPELYSSPSRITPLQEEKKADEPDYYEILGVSRYGETQFIRFTFNSKVKQFQPDKHGNTPGAIKRFELVSIFNSEISLAPKSKVSSEPYQSNNCTIYCGREITLTQSRSSKPTGS